MKAWHFVGDTLLNGALVPADGERLSVKPPIVICEHGLHASNRLIDALQYAPGHTICRVECSGAIVHQGDKLAAEHRTILWRVDGEELLHDFARKCALDVIHLWNAPDVVRQYLTTGDETIRAAAWAAARAAARSATWVAAKYAAMYAAMSAASDAAWAAAKAAAYATARDAAYASARDAASAAAYAAARDAARADQNKWLTRMLMQAHRRAA